MGARSVFVTGANSFLGATLVRLLIEQGYETRGLVRPGANDILLRDLPYKRVTADLLQPDTYRPALAGCVAFYHVAASYAHDPEYITEMQAVNVEGARLALTAAIAAGIPRLLHTSTIGTIGQPDEGGLATEETPFNLPNPSAYVRSKLAGQRLAEELAGQGAHIVIVHPTGMLGPGDWRPSASGRLVLATLRGEWAPYPARGINWCPVEDVARGMILALERGQPGRRYILGHQAGNLDRDAFYALMEAASGVPRPQLPPTGFKQRLGAFLRGAPAGSSRPTVGAGPERLTCNPARAVRELGMPQSDLLANARAEVDWYRRRGYLGTKD